MSLPVTAVFFCIFHIVVVLSWKDTFSGVTVEFGETSGRIKISNENNSITVSFKKLIEIAVDGVTEVGKRSSLKHHFKNFDYQYFAPGGPAEFVDVYSEEGKSNISVYKKNFTTTLNGPGATFNVELWVYGNDTIIRNWESAETYQVHNGTVKIAFSIENWLFCGYNDTNCRRRDDSDYEYGHYLDVYLNYYAGRKDEKPVAGRVRGRSDVYGRRPPTFNYGGAEVTSSQMYMLNGTWDSIPRYYPKLVRAYDHNYVEKNYEVIRLPAFFSPIYYNVFVNISTSEYNSSSPNHVSSCASTIFLSILTVLCAWYLH